MIYSLHLIGNLLLQNRWHQMIDPISWCHSMNVYKIWILNVLKHRWFHIIILTSLRLMMRLLHWPWHPLLAHTVSAHSTFKRGWLPKKQTQLFVIFKKLVLLVTHLDWWTALNWYIHLTFIHLIMLSSARIDLASELMNVSQLLERWNLAHRT